MSLFKTSIRKLVVSLCGAVLLVGCTDDSALKREASKREASETSEVRQEDSTALAPAQKREDSGVNDTSETPKSAEPELRPVPHSDSTNAYQVQLSEEEDSLFIGRDTIVVKVSETPAQKVVGSLMRTEPDTVYQYIRGVIADVRVSVNRDTVLTKRFTISDVLAAQSTDLEHADSYILMLTRTLLEEDSTRVAIRPVANIPDTDAKLMGEKWYVYPLDELSGGTETPSSN